MSAIAMDLPQDVSSARDGIVAFAESEVLPRHERNRDMFENPRDLYREDGRFSDELLGLINEVRTASAAAGFYQMCVPESLGGRRTGSSRLLRGLGGALPPLRPAELADALRAVSLGVRPEPPAHPDNAQRLRKRSCPG